MCLSTGIQNWTRIDQPVLQWGSSAAGGGKRWSVASWYADSPTGVSFHTDLVDVSVGQSLTGIMWLTGQPLPESGPQTRSSMHSNASPALYARPLLTMAGQGMRNSCTYPFPSALARNASATPSSLSASM